MPHRLAGCLAICGPILLLLFAGCSRDEDPRASLPWPPDTLKAELVGGHLYKVSVGHGYPPIMMTMVCPWPPDTLKPVASDRMQTVTSGRTPWPPDTLIASRSPCAPSFCLTWPPDTLSMGK